MLPPKRSILKDSFKNYSVLLAVLVVAIVWGTTFLGIRIAVETVPPWFVAGIRQCIAALLILPYLIYKKQLKMLSGRDLMIQMILSTLMLIGANGLTTVAEKDLSSSLASLISSSSPLMVFILSLLFGMQKFNLKALSGVILGFCGILLIFWDGLSDLANEGYRNGIIAMGAAVMGWALGTIFSKKNLSKPQNIFLNLFYQFAFAGVVQVVFGLMSSDKIEVSEWSFKSWAAILYLGIFGSVAAYFAFNFLLKKLAPTQVSILSYVNTIIAIFLGWLVLDEEISWQFILAAVMIISGVFITNKAMKAAAFAKKADHN